ncbi:hypothetical protein J7K93_03895 [bacterium]|nr:hypothetical protein [bacterium]
MSEHLTEYELQNYIENPDSASGRKAAVHVENCDTCKVKLEEYSIIFDGLTHSPDSFIDDNICSKIVESIIPSEKVPFFSTWSIILFSALLGGAVFYTAFLTHFSAFNIFLSGIFSAIKEAAIPFVIFAKSRNPFASLTIISLSAIMLIAFLDTIASKKFGAVSSMLR